MGTEIEGDARNCSALNAVRGAHGTWRQQGQDGNRWAHVPGNIPKDASTAKLTDSIPTVLCYSGFKSLADGLNGGSGFRVGLRAPVTICHANLVTLLNLACAAIEVSISGLTNRLQSVHPHTARNDSPPAKSSLQPQNSIQQF